MVDGEAVPTAGSVSRTEGEHVVELERPADGVGGALRSTRTADRIVAQQIAGKHHVGVLERRAGLRPPKPVKLTEHIKTYVAHTAKTNRSSYKDQAVLDRLVASIGDKPISEVSPVSHRKMEAGSRGDREPINGQP